MVSFILTSDGGNNPAQVDPNQMTGTIDDDNYDFVDEDSFPDPDSNDDAEYTDEGDDE